MRCEKKLIFRLKPVERLGRSKTREGLCLGARELGQNLSLAAISRKSAENSQGEARGAR